MSRNRLFCFLEVYNSVNECDPIETAKEMLLDLSKEDQDLLYDICKLDEEGRVAIMKAYQELYGEDDGMDRSN